MYTTVVVACMYMYGESDDVWLELFGAICAFIWNVGNVATGLEIICRGTFMINANELC